MKTLSLVVSIYLLAAGLICFGAALWTGHYLFFGTFAIAATLTGLWTAELV